MLVPLYPRPLQSRHAQATVQLQQAVSKLQTRTSMVDSGFPVAPLPAVIDHNFSGSGNPQVYANGATALTGPYGCLASYTPRASDSVILVPVPAMNTYIVAGTTTAGQAVAAPSTAWQTVALTSGWSGTVQYRFPDPLALNVQVTGQVTLPSGTYNDVEFGAVTGAYSPTAARNWPVTPLAGITYGNATYPGAPHAFAQPGGALYLYGIPGSLNGDAVDVSGIYAI